MSLIKAVNVETDVTIAKVVKRKSEKISGK